MQFKLILKGLICAILLSAFHICGYAQVVDTKGSAYPAGAKVGLIHHYYLPGVVLKYQKELALTQQQIEKLKSISATLKLKKAETEISDNRNEHMLDSLFRTGKVNEGVIIFYTNRYGLYAGEYRGALLIAAYTAHNVLTKIQLNKLVKLENHN